MKYFVTHQTRYLYSEKVSISYNRVHSRPCALPTQSSGNCKLLIQPEPATIDTERDFFGNPIAFFTVQKAHKELEVTVSFDAEVRKRDIFGESLPWEKVAEELKNPRERGLVEASQFRHDSNWVRRSDKLSEFARRSFPKGVSVLEGARELCRRIYHDFEFDPTATTVATPVDDVLEKGRGVCQDFAHLALGGLRSLGLASRYVSGYILTLPPPGQPGFKGPTPVTPGFRFGVLHSAGWISTPPTISWFPTSM